MVDNLSLIMLLLLFLSQMMSVLKQIWCGQNQMLPQSEVVEVKLEEVIKVSEIPKAASAVLKAKSEDKSRMCPKCGQTFKVCQVSWVSQRCSIKSFSYFFSFLIPLNLNADGVQHRHCRVRPTSEAAQGQRVQQCLSHLREAV